MIPELVTICITTFNRANLISSAIERVLNQTYRNIEIIIVDDCSSDSTEATCSKLLAEHELSGSTIKISYVRHAFNKGLSAARNTAINRAAGKFFTFIDDDDSWENTFIEDFLATASQYDETWCFCCGMKLTKNTKYTVTVPNLNGPLKNYFIQGFTPPVAGQFYHTEVLKKLGGYKENIKTCVDHDLWLTLAINDINIKSVDKPLALPNSDMTLERITNNPSKRLTRLEDTLSIWRPMIIENFGEKFFNEFSSAYRAQETKGFLYKVLLRNGLYEGAGYYFQNKQTISIKELLRDLIKFTLSRAGVIHHFAKPVEKYGPGIPIKSAFRSRF